MGGGAAWPAGVLGQGWACGRITQDRKMQREGLQDSDWPSIYFGSKHKLYKKCTTGSLVSAGSEARPGRETAAGRRSAAGSVNWTEHRSSGSRRPSASVYCGRTDTFCPVDGTGSRPATGLRGRRSLPAAPPSWPRAKEPIVHFPAQLCFVSKYNSEQYPFLSHSRRILRSCDPQTTVLK